MTRTLLVTNDFPPRRGGIQTFVHGMATRIPPDDLVVYASTSSGAAEFDAALPFEVIRENTGLLLPTPGVARRAAEIAGARDCDTVWFGASAPLGLLAEGLKRSTGVRHAVALTHGHEVAWAALPGARAALRRIAAHTDIMTFLGEYTRVRLEAAIGRLTRLEKLTFGVNVAQFAPEVDGKPVRVRHALGDRPVIVCVSRLVPRKGQDMLIKALPTVRRRVPDAALLLVGDGPYRRTLRRMAIRYGVSEHVVVTGAVAARDLPEHYAAGDVFAMPCRTRRRGLDVEGLGLVYLEAAATGLPVLAGDSGGAPDAVRDGETGYVVDGRDAPAIAERLIQLLTDASVATRLGEAGRDWMCEEWTWKRQADKLARLLGLSVG